MSTATNASVPRVDQFLMAAEARFDRWRALLQEARLWDRSTNQQTPGKHHAAVTKCFNELRQWEDYFAYPGQTLLKSLEERIASSNASGTARLLQSMSAALLTHSYRSSAADWEGEGQAAINLGEQVPVSGEESAATTTLLRSARGKSGEPNSMAGAGAGSPQATQTLRQIHL